MSVVALAPTPNELAAAPEGRIVSVGRVRGMGVFLILLALVMAGPWRYPCLLAPRPHSSSARRPPSAWPPW